MKSNCSNSVVLREGSDSKGIGLACLEIIADAEVKASCAVIVCCKCISVFVIKLAVHIEAVVGCIHSPITACL